MWARARAFILAGSIGFAISVPTAGAQAGPLVLQGSTTVTSRVIGPFKADIEAASGQELTVIPNRSDLGVLALLEGDADLAMISSSLDKEIDAVKSRYPALTDKLRGFELARTRLALAIHPSNPVRKITRVNLKSVLLGQITNWRDLGGPDLPIRLVAVRDGGGTVLTMKTQLLDGRHLAVPDSIRVQNGSQVITVVEQEAGALGISQLKRLRERNGVELVVDHPIEQILMLVSLGEPTAAMLAVIAAARSAALQNE
ncbi:MAG: phosphate transport system substrate-binding protein [Bradyrhizobium sp.]|jgi:phosphate transport system substrate-binding protein|nr:phosphate transport system substrate-binding protein [Bradyrhizobium sp.]